MHRLPVSLLLVTVVAIFGVGLALDTVFERYSSNTSDLLAPLRSFGHSFAMMLNSSESPDDIISQWPASMDYQVALEGVHEFPLPPSLKPAFEAGEPLVLEYEQGVSLHFLLDQHEQVLSVHNNTVSGRGGDRVAWLFTSIFYLGTLALVLLWLRPLLHRLHLLRITAKAFGAGDLSSRVEAPGVTYIQDIENDFNRMASQIQRLVEDNKLLTSAVSHDLRTPLARLRFGIDTFAEESLSEKQQLYLGRINSDLNEMESLVNSLLQYARLDNVLEGMQKQSVSLRSLLDECISQYYHADVSIQIDTSALQDIDSLSVQGCIEHLAMLINNLLQNAVDYAQHSVLVRLRHEDGCIELAFCDDGPGIALDKRLLVMKPFERGMESTRKGYGLGLAVSAIIAKHHRGTIEIDECKELGGARIVVQLESEKHGFAAQ